MVQINCYVLFLERGMPNNCIVCGRMKVPGPGLEISLHRFPKSHVLRSKWLEGLSLAEVDVGPDSRVCSLHFWDGNAKSIPSISIGPKFAEMPSRSSVRTKRRALRSSFENLSKRPRQQPLVATPPCSSTSIVDQSSSIVETSAVM